MLNWLVIGIGDITRKRVLPAILAEPRSNLYGVLTRDPRKAEAYAGSVAFTDIGEALRDPATTLIEYTGGIHAVVDVRWNSRIQRDQFRVVGVEGEINLDSLNGPTLRLMVRAGKMTAE